MANGLFNLKQVVQAVQQGGWPAQKPPQVEYLVVAGGGSGGGGAGYSGGGGGAGGVLYGIDPVPNGQTVLVTVGAGGTASAGQINGTSGSDSLFGQIIATGGGYGSYGQGSAAATGGSGGGTGSNNTTISPYGAQGVAGQGFVGGAGWPETSGGAGGGGGAGTVGAAASRAASAGNGGQGLGSIISGTLVTYAGGGGGGGHNSNLGGQGGTGGGGNGSTGTSTPAQAGSTNRGAGGGGAGNQSSGGRIGGNGGSGVVIVSYPDVYAAAASTTGSPTVSTSGSGSVAFSGTGQYLSTPSNSGFAFGTGDFTVEAWVYANNLSSERGFFQTSATAGGLQSSYTDGVAFLARTGQDGINVNVGGTVLSTGAVMVINTWYHIAVTRASNAVRVFLNGVLTDGPTTVTANLAGTYAAVGGYYNSSYLWNGNISNLRVVKGTAVYTSAFTPSKTPLTAISGTSLLMNTVSGAQFADGSSNALALTATGSPIWSASSPFTSTGYKNRVYTWTSSGSITF